MRQIKFRAWHKTGEAMMPDVKNVHTLNSEFQNDNLIFMQFTGLKDRNGVEVYEGDLVKKDDDKFVKAGVVSFIHGCWMVASKSGEQYFNLHWHLSQVEVIGNIHQNPELLEQKQ